MRSERLGVLGLLLTATAGVSALEPKDLFIVQKGPMLLKPQLTTSLTFSDNVNYREENKLSDFLATFSPGIAIQVGAKEYNHFEASYFYDRLQYFDHQEFNANQHRLALRGRFQRSRFTLDGSDKIEFLASPIGGGLSLQGQLVERWTFTDSYRLSYDLSDRTGVYAGVLHGTTDYSDDLSLYDSQTLQGTLGFQYRGFSRTFFFGEVYFGQTKSEADVATLPEYPTATFVGGFVGARGNFTEKLIGTVKAGYETRSYEGVSEGSSAPVVETALTYKISEATVANLVYARRQNESAQFVRTTFVTDTVVLSLDQDFGADERLHGGVNLSYTNAKYETNAIFARDRNDQMASLGLTLAYDVKLWMRVFGGYSFEWLDSTEPTILDYTVNRVTVGVQLGY